MRGGRPLIRPAGAGHLLPQAGEGLHPLSRLRERAGVRAAAAFLRGRAVKPRQVFRQAASSFVKLCQAASSAFPAPRLRESSVINGLRRAEGGRQGRIRPFRGFPRFALRRDGDGTAPCRRALQSSRRPSPHDRESTKEKTSTISDQQKDIVARGAAGSNRSGRRNSPSISWRRKFRLKRAVKGARKRAAGLSCKRTEPQARLRHSASIPNARPPARRRDRAA